ncbi:MAG: DUF58 domain-containing protein [Elusimicrobia bacterium]|nr:DUF58 domain-containing protein [Elusimicrobiota bacterium]
MKFIDDATLARIKSFKYSGLNVNSESLLSGEHPSRSRKGISQEFAEYRHYAIGDDTRFIDWKVYAKRDRLFIKEFIEEKAAVIHFLADASGSMNFKGSGAAFSKWEYSARLLMSLACLCFIKGDYCGLYCMSGSLNREIPPGASLKHAAFFDSVLEKTNPSGDSIPLEDLKLYVSKMEKNSVLVVFSDLMFESEKIASISAIIGTKKIRTYVFHVIDGFEKDIPWKGPLTFLDMETNVEMPIVPDYVRDSYNAEFSKWLKLCKTLYTTPRTRYFPAFTDMRIDGIIEKFITLT